MGEGERWIGVLMVVKGGLGGVWGEKEAGLR